MELKNTIAKEECWVIYPGDNAVNLDLALRHLTEDPLAEDHDKKIIEQSLTGSKKPTRILLLDGTWKKAYKLWQLNPWLHALPKASIENAISHYKIRKAPKEQYLSTLEAAAICLAAIEDVDVKPLYNCFTLMQQPFINNRGSKSTKRQNSK